MHQGPAFQRVDADHLVGRSYVSGGMYPTNV